MPDSSLNTLRKLVKEIAVGAFAASKPTAIFYGTVLSTNPLKVSVDQKFTVGAEFLLRSSLVQNYSVNIVIDGEVKSCTIRQGLTTGEKVILVRIQGGQKYLILDRVT